jgi:hypothetical protein
LGAITKSNSKYVYAASYPTYELLDPVTQEPIWFNAFVSNAIDLPKPMCVRSFQMPLEKSSATLATQVDLSRTELVDGAVQNSDVSIYPGALANQVIGTWASKFTHRPVSLCRVAHAYFGYYAMAIGSQRLTIVEEINAGEVTVSSVPVNTVVAHTYNPLFPELGGSYLETSGSEFRPDDFEPYYALVFGVE